jgi:hypothetical protein
MVEGFIVQSGGSISVGGDIVEAFSHAAAGLARLLCASR